MERGKEALPPGLEIGSAVTVHTTANPGQKGVIKYWGPIVGATGSWLGVELDTPTGKNSGSSGGQVYFDCRPNHGVFLKPNQVKLIEVTEEEAKRRIKPKAAIASGSMIGSGLKSLGPKRKDEEDGKEEEKKDQEKREKMRQDARHTAEQRRQAVLQKVSEKRGQAAERASLAADEDLSESQGSDSDLARLRAAIIAKEDSIEELKNDLRRQQIDTEEVKQEASRELKRKQQTWEETEFDLRAQISSLESKLKAKPKQSKAADESDLQELIEMLTLDKELAEGNAETLKREKEELEEQLTELREEIELRNLELEQIQSEGSSDLGNAELKLAFKKLYSETEQKRIQYEDRIMALEHQISSIPSLQAKADQLLTIRAEMEKKEGELNDLREALDEASSYGSMLEKMTEQNLKLGERVKELEAQLAEIEEVREIETQIAEDQVELEKYLNDEIHNKDVEILDLKRIIGRKDEDVADLERVINQFRQKVVQLTSEGSVMKEQLEKSGETEKLKKMQELIEKNLQLQNKARELRGYGLTAKVSELQRDQIQAQINALLPLFPAPMLDSLEFQGLSNLTMLRTTMKKAALLVAEFLDRIGDYQNQPNLLAWIFDVSSNCINYLCIARELECALKEMQPAKYHSTSRAADWGQVQALNSALDFLFRLLREEDITASTPLDSLKLCIEAVARFKDLHSQQGSIQFEVGRMVYLSVVGVSVAYSTHGLNRSFSGSKEIQEIVNRMSGAAQRLLGSNCQWELEGSLSSLRDTLSLKLHTLTQLLFGDKRSLAETFDWLEWISDIDRDIRSITITAAYKAMNDDEPASVPWKVLIHETQTSLEQFERAQAELIACKGQIKELSLRIVILDKELSEVKITKLNLETRLGDAHMKAQRLAQLEIEAKRLMEKEKHFEDSIQALQVANEKLKKRNIDLEDEMKKFQEEDSDHVMGGLLSSSKALSSLINVSRGSGLVHAPVSRLQSDVEDVKMCKAIIDAMQMEKARLSAEFVLSKLRGSGEDPQLQDCQPGAELVSKLRGIRSVLHRKVANSRIIDLSRPDCQLKQAGFTDEVARLCKEAKAVVNELASQSTGEASTFRSAVSSAVASDLSKAWKVRLGTLQFGAGSDPPVEMMVSSKELRTLHAVFNLA